MLFKKVSAKSKFYLNPRSGFCQDVMYLKPHACKYNYFHLNKKKHPFVKRLCIEELQNVGASAASKHMNVQSMNVLLWFLKHLSVYMQPV